MTTNQTNQATWLTQVDALRARQVANVEAAWSYRDRGDDERAAAFDAAAQSDYAELVAMGAM